MSAGPEAPHGSGTAPARPTVPTRAALKQRDGRLAGTTWGLFDDPWRGTPSFAGAEQAAAAAALVRRGEVFGLDYAADAFTPGMSQTRKPLQHVIFGNHAAHRDDYVDSYYLQASSQIDGLRHRRADDVGFYGGVPDARVVPGTPDLGVQVWADDPIVTRGVLVDLVAHRARRSATIDHRGGEPVRLAEVEAALAAQGVELRPGDVVMLHTGWAEWFLDLDLDQKTDQRASRRASGLAQSEEIVDWAWDNRLAVLAADNFAVECLPPVADSPFTSSAPSDRGMMHQELLAKLGLPLGELWRLGPLSRRMGELEQWEAMVVIKPLNLTGATGSPANATAVL